MSTKSKDGKKTRTKTAQQLIHETPVAPPATLSTPPSTANAAKTESNGFMKPAGVDAPPLAAAPKSGAKKRHRDRDAASDGTDSKGKKRKKRTAEAGLATVE